MSDLSSHNIEEVKKGKEEKVNEIKIEEDVSAFEELFRNNNA